MRQPPTTGRTKKQQAAAARQAQTRYWPICVRQHPMRWYPRGKQAGGYWQCPTCRKGAKPVVERQRASTILACALCHDTGPELEAGKHPWKGGEVLLCPSCARTAAGLSA
jgi:hypothetical protein